MADKVVSILSKILASTYALYLKTQNYHWNVTGAHFHDLHKMFESQYEALAEAIDKIAEQIRATGNKAPATFKAYASLSEVKDGNEKLPWQQMVEDLYLGHLTVCKLLEEGLAISEKANDQVVNDLFIQRLAHHKKDAWMLKSIVE
jgi:starvation-inducible DNA-binding protein